MLWELGRVTFTTVRGSSSGRQEGTSFYEHVCQVRNNLPRTKGIHFLCYRWFPAIRAPSHETMNWLSTSLTTCSERWGSRWRRLLSVGVLVCCLLSSLDLSASAAQMGKIIIRSVKLPVLQGNDVRFARFSPSDGLSQIRVSEIVQDNQ